MSASVQLSKVACEQCGADNAADARFCRGCGESLDGDAVIGQQVLGRYEVKGLLGEGGMGRVYIAEHKIGSALRRVAVKTLHPELSNDRQIVARFRRECETIVGLRHPNTVDVYDFGELDDGTLVLVMEYIEGKDLSVVLETGALSPERVTNLIIQICGSLHEAHENGVVHRDLKPENVILAAHGDDVDFAKVLDFGIAKQAEADERTTKLTQKGTVLGTPPYMSPEQFGAEEIDRRSDIYALGVMTYELLTGKLPFNAKTPWEWATQHLTATPIPIQEAASQRLPIHQVNAVMRALQRDPNDRFETAKDFMRSFCGAEDSSVSWALATSGGTGMSSTSTDHQPVIPGQRNYKTPAIFAIASFLAVVGLGLGGFALYKMFGAPNEDSVSAQDKDPTDTQNTKAEVKDEKSDDKKEIGTELVEKGVELPALKDPALTKSTKKSTRRKNTRKKTRTKTKTEPELPPTSDPGYKEHLTKLRAAVGGSRPNLAAAIRAFRAAKSAGAPESSLSAPRTQIGRIGTNKISGQIISGDCRGAQSTYRALRSVGASAAADRGQWGDHCRKP